MTEEDYQDIFLGSLALWTIISLLFQYLVDRALETLDALPFRTADTLTALYILLTSLPSPLSLIPPQTPPPVIQVLLGTIFAIAGCAGVGLACVSWHVFKLVHKSCHPFVVPLPIEIPSPALQCSPLPQPDPLTDLRSTSWLKSSYKPPPPPTEEEIAENDRLRSLRWIEQEERLRWLVEYTWLSTYTSVLEKANNERFWDAIGELYDRRDDRRDQLTWSDCRFDWKRHPKTLELVQRSGKYDWAITAIEEHPLAPASESIEAWKEKWILPELPQVPVTHLRRKLIQPSDDKLKRSSTTPIITSVIKPADDARVASPQQTNISALVASTRAAALPRPIPSITPPLKSAKSSEVALPIPSSTVEPVSTTNEPIIDIDDAPPTSSPQPDPIEIQHQQDSVCASSVAVVSASPLTSPPSLPVELKPSADETPSTPVSKYEVILPLPGLWASMHSPINRLRTSPNTPSTPAPRSSPQTESYHTSSDDGPSTPRNVETLSSVQSPPCECPLNHTHRGCGPFSSPVEDNLLSYSPTFADDSDSGDDERGFSLEVASDAGYESVCEFNVTADNLCDLFDVVSIEKVVDAPVLPSQEVPSPFIDTTSQPEADFIVPQQHVDFASQTIASSVPTVPSAAFSPSLACSVPVEEASLVIMPHVDSTMALLQRFEDVSMDAEVNVHVELAPPNAVAAFIPQHTAAVIPSAPCEDMETQGDKEDEDLEEVVCSVLSARPFGDADDDEEGEMEEDLAAPDIVLASEAQLDTGMADGEADADGIDDDGQWEEPSVTASRVGIATDFESNLDFLVPMEAAMPSASSWGYVFEVEQPYASSSNFMQLSVVPDEDKDKDMPRMVPSPKVGMEDFQPLLISDHFMPITSSAGSGNAYLLSIPAPEATMEDDGARQHTPIATSTAPDAPQDEHSNMVDFFKLMETLKAIPTSGADFALTPAQLVEMSAYLEPAVSPTGDMDFPTFLPPHGTTEPTMPPAPPSDFAFNLSCPNEAPTTAPENPMSVEDLFGQMFDALRRPPLAPAQIPAFTTPALELAKDKISLKEHLGSPNTVADPDDLVASEDDDFGDAPNSDGGGAWASEEEQHVPSKTLMPSRYIAPSTQDVPVNQGQVRGLPRRVLKSATSLQVGSATASPPPVQPQLSSTIGQFTPATASAAPALVPGSARVIKKVPKRFAERGELVYKPDVLVDGSTKVTSDTTRVAPPLKMVMGSPASTASSRYKRTFGSDTSVVSPAYATLAQAPSKFNFGAEATAPTTIPGPSSFTFAPSTPSASSVLATEETTPRVFKSAPRARARVSAASLTPAQGTNESGMTEAELRESLSQEDRLEGRGRDEDRLRESDSESEYSDGQDDYVINEED